MKLEAKHRLTAKTFRPLTRESSGTYVCVLPDEESTATLLRIGDYLGIKVDSSELHCTLSYAKGCFPKQAKTSKARRFSARIAGLQFWDGHDNDGYLVVMLDSLSLIQRNQYWAAHGLKHSFDDYSPHVTLVSKLDKTPELITAMDKTSRVFINRTLVFNNETIEGLKAKAKE